MAAQIAGYTDTQNLDGILFTSKHNKIPKSSAALRHTSNMSFLAITNLDKITQFEYRYAEVRKAHDALLLFMANTPGRYTYRPALCPALRGHQKSPWLPFLGQAPTVDMQLWHRWHRGQKHLPARSYTSAPHLPAAKFAGSASSVIFSEVPKSLQPAPHATTPARRSQTTTTLGLGSTTFHWNPAAPSFTSTMGKRSTWKIDRINAKE